jgi:hypothetical protein
MIERHAAGFGGEEVSGIVRGIPSFGGFDDGAERVAIVGISGQRLGVQHELAAWGAGTRQRTNRCLERKPRLVRPR